MSAWRAGWVWIGLLTCAFAQTGQKIEKIELKVKGDTVTIVRDSYGVPHVRANTLYGLFYGNGYAIAQDRLWQMERYRRQAKGELAELMGPSAAEQDKATRLEGYTEEERWAQFERLPQDGKEALQAYADGVNAWIKEATAKGSLPEGYKQAGISPREWSVTDSVAIGTMMVRRFGSAGGELRNLALLIYLRLRNKEKAEMLLNELAWLNDPSSPTTIPPGEDARKPKRYAPQVALQRLQAHAKNLPNVGFDVLLPALRFASSQPQIEFAQAHGLPAYLGSYAILVSPQKSASGYAMLVGAPQMGFTTPCIAHEIHLQGAGIQVIGISFAGVPGVLIGHTAELAWTMTSGIHDQVDCFIEKVNPDNPDEYWYKDRWVRFQKRTEQIKVKDSKPITLEVYRSVHGPIVAFDRVNKIAFAKAMSFWDQELETMRMLWGVYQARSIEEVGKAASLGVASFNFFCATKKGEIGFWYCGRPPIRAEGVDPRLPVWGTGEYDWKGILPFEQMPHLINPKQGFLVNWNNKPAPWWDNSDTPFWGAIFRVQRLIDLAKSKPLLTPDDLKQMIIDIASYDLDAEHLKPFLLQAARKYKEKLIPEMRQAIRYLEAWDNHAYEGCVAKTIFDEWLNTFRARVFMDEYGDFLDRNLFNLAIQPSLILYTLQGKKATVPRLHDFFNGKVWDQVVLEALREALQSLKRKHGDEMSRWRYHVPRMRLAPLPDVPYSNRGTYIQVVELSSPDIQGENVLPPGQSEHPDSPHYSDQRDLASWWMFKPMLFKPEQLPR